MPGTEKDNQGMLQKNAAPQTIHTHPEEDYQNPYAWIEEQRMDETSALWEHSQKLTKSEHRIFGIKHKDSEEMAAVKRYQEAIANIMSDYLIPDNEQEFQAQLAEIEALYQELVKASGKYIATHKNPHSASGKARLELVRKTRALAMHEMTQYRGHAEKIWQKEHGKKKINPYGRALTAMRGTEFDLDRVREGKTLGEATSEVRVVQVGQETFYCKADEKFASPLEEFQQKYPEEAWSEGQAPFLGELRHLMVLKNRKGQAWLEVFLGNLSQEDARALKEADTDEKIAQITKIIWEKIKAGGMLQPESLQQIDIEDKEIQKKLREILLRYQMWSNRQISCGNAKIDEGESLSARNILTSRMAYLMNLPGLVANANAATLHHSNREEQAYIAMEQAKGEAHGAILERAKERGKKVIYTPEAVRQFSCLQLFDALCGQIDRHANNRFVTVTEETEQYIKIGSVQAIDHDLSFGNLNFEDLKWSHANLLPLV